MEAKAEDRQTFDGAGRGSFDADGMTWCYEVSGTLEEPRVQVCLVTHHVNTP